MRNVLMMVFALLMSAPAFAQGRVFDVMAHASWVDISGEDAIDFDEIDEDPLVNFEADQGWGAGVNVFIGGRFSLEVAAATVTPELSIESGNSPIPGFVAGDLNMIPITGVVQWHFAPNGSFDVYVGGGVAYILFDDVSEAEDLDEVEIDSIDFDDDYGTVFNVGLTMGLTRAIGLNLDAKYVPAEASARVRFADGTGDDLALEVNPLILSAGIRIMF